MWFYYKFIILGRNFEYDRALEIIQEEEYLEDVDFDDIKRYDTSYLYKKMSEIIPDFNIPKDKQSITHDFRRLKTHWRLIPPQKLIVFI